MLTNYVLLDKTPIPEPDIVKWAMWFESANRRVAHDVIENGLEVSTVFIGIDHNYGDGPPLLFETMLKRGDDYGPEQWRYSTWEQAETGHNCIVKALMDNEELP